MIRVAPSVRRFRVSLAFGTSTLACGLLLPTAAHAQCAPDPTQPNQTTICAGTDSDGIRVTTNGSTVQVNGSAKVTGDNAPAVAVDIPQQADVFEPRAATVVVAGTVDGQAQSGISVVSGAAAGTGYDPYGTQVTISVRGGATVTGDTAVTTGSSSGNSFGAALIDLDNAGTISGTSGVALLATDPARGGFNRITNAASGSIGAISGAVGQLTNAGLIDGGSHSGIDQTTTYNSGVFQSDWTNTGTIRSASTAATIANLGQSQVLTNSGTISDAGAGAAVQGQNITVNNLAGGAISTAGTVAIAAASAITLANAGTITGDVVADPSQGTGFYSTIDSSAGTIAGNVTLGGGNDLVYARYVGTSTLVIGITGVLDAGEGTNSIVLAPATDIALNSPVTLPAGFQRLRLEPARDATLTLANGFVAPGTMELTGAGVVVNQAAITTAGQAFVQPFPGSGASPSLVNSGSIQASVAQGFYAIDLGFGAKLTNTGTIGSTGNGVSLSFGTLSNTGSIVAAGSAVTMFDAALDNQGLIRSTDGIGASLSGNANNTPAINAGRIEGATYGVLTDYAVTNSGTIAAIGSGTAVGLQNYGSLTNLAGGVITGGTYAIAGANYYAAGSTPVFNASVYNAGTINGDVVFASGSGIYPDGNSFVALLGGVLNGNLSLGHGDTLVTDLVNNGPGSFSGINGTVTSDGGLLRYRVSGDAAATIGPVGPFATTGYELVDGAHLTLTAPTTQTLPIVLAGIGTVALDVNADTVNQSALNAVQAAGTAPMAPTGMAGLNIISRGTLAGTINDYFAGAFGVAALGNNDSLDNEGTIRATYNATNGGQSYNAAVIGGSSLLNNGRIELDGSYGAYGVAMVTNTGSITQTGAGTSIGISGATSVINSGSIQTAGIAISSAYFGPTYSIVNSGSITSTGNSAIGGGLLNTTVNNLATGTISGGGGSAIEISGGTVSNAGAIIGDVDLGGYLPESVYVADGGTLTGDLTLSAGDDLFLQRGEVTGVSGTIDAGGGRDVFGRVLSSSGTVAIGPAPAAGFTDALIAAMGPDTIATLTSVDPSLVNLYAVGDGTVVNQAMLAGPLFTSAPTYAMRQVVGDGPLGGLMNLGNIAGGVSGSITRFNNAGTIGSGTLDGPAVALVNPGTLSFGNSGQITARRAMGNSSYLAATDLLSVANTGSIDPGLIAIADFGTQGVHGALTVINSGAINNAVSGAALDLAATASAASAGGSVSVDNRGSLLANGTGSVAGLTLSLDGTGAPIDYVVRNSGDITAVSASGGVGIDVANVGSVGGTAVTGTISNGTTGTVRATGPNATGIQVEGAGLTLANAGRIEADGAGAFAIRAVGAFANSITNTGTIVGDLLLGAGNDTVENRGAVTGGISLAGGNDNLVQQVGAVLTGVADGGAGTDTLTLDAAGGGTFNGSQFVNFERLRQVGTGTVTYAGPIQFNSIEVSSGRLVGQAGSVTVAPDILVRPGATFGSAGTVTGNLAVGGTLSPGASPGTMIVNGNVALSSGSTTLFELSPAVSDKLVVNGQVSIAPGGTLQLVEAGALRPGTSYQLITATNGITGNYTTVSKPADLFGFIVQRANEIDLLGEFVDPGNLGPQVSRSIAYANRTLEAQPSTSTLFAALPTLLTSAGAADPVAFARLTPEPYASAVQIGTDDALLLVGAARGSEFAATSDGPHAFTFASGLGQWHRLGDDPGAGTAAARTRGYGLLGGIGYGDSAWSIGAFGGYLNNHQTIGALGARTKADGAIGGVQARVHTARGLGMHASVIYDGSQAVTTRILPVGTAFGRYDLHSWIGDLTASYEIGLRGDWAMTPQIGVTYLRTTRDGVTEAGASPFALTVAGGA